METISQQTVNILPIGDSITDGAGTHSGYRYFLHNLLYKAGVNFKFVGPKKAYDPRMPDRYLNHAGYGGNTIGPDKSQNGNIFDRLPDILNRPVDIALLMLGRNNYFQSIDLDRIDEVYYNFVKEMLKYQPEMHVFIGTMNYSKSGNDPDDPALSGLNLLLPDVCKRLISEGYNIHFVDIATESNLGEVDFKPHDNTHPNDIGQEKIARVWFDAILPIAKKMSDSLSKKQDIVRVEAFELAQKQLDLRVGNEVQLTPIFTPSNPDEFAVLWTSSDDETVKIDTHGRLEAIKAGCAEITAESLDGGIIAKCRIAVSENKEIEKTVIFDNAFSSRDKWLGNNEMINDNVILMWFIRKDFAVSSVEKVNVSDRFEISMRYEITDNKGMVFGHFTSVKFGGLEMRIGEGATLYQILVDGEVVAEQKSYHDIETRVYTLRYNKGEITLFKGGEILAKAFAEIDFVPSDIKLYSNEGERFCIIHNLKICDLI